MLKGLSLNSLLNYLYLLVHHSLLQLLQLPLALQQLLFQLSVDLLLHKAVLVLLHGQRLLPQEVLPPDGEVHPAHIHLQHLRPISPVKHVAVPFPLLQHIAPNRHCLAL